MESNVGTVSKRPKWRFILVIVGGVIIHLSLGTVYTYGNFAPYLVSYVRAKNISADLRYDDAAWIFAMMTLGQGFSGFLGGVLERLAGPRFTTIFGSWIMSGSMMVTYFTIDVSFAACLMTYGLLYGVGLGIAYPIPLGCAMRWMPERKGFIVGFVVAGFGGGAFVFNQVITSYINPNNLNPDIDVKGEQFFSQSEVLDNVRSSFLVLGGIYAAMQLIGTIMICNPPPVEDASVQVATPRQSVAGEVNEVYTLTSSNEVLATPRKESTISFDETTLNNQKSKSSIRKKNSRTASVISIARNQTPLAMLKTKSFYMLWLLFVANGQSMVLISTLYKAYGQSFIKNDKFLSLVGAFASVCNAAGRILWGYVADRSSFKTAQLCITALMTCLFATLNLSELGREPVFFIWICLIFLTFSGSFSTFPSVTMKCFGAEYYSVNYGIMFTSQAVTAVIGALLAQSLRMSIGWHGMFFLASGISAFASIIAFFFEEPTVNKASTG